jgi:hypothetical protein
MKNRQKLRASGSRKYERVFSLQAVVASANADVDPTNRIFDAGAIRSSPNAHRPVDYRLRLSSPRLHRYHRHSPEPCLISRVGVAC